MQRPHRAAHRRIWTVLAVLIPATLVVALLSRQVEPVPATAVQLSSSATPETPAKP